MKINLKQISPELNFNCEKEIENSSNVQIDLTIGEKHFSVYFYGIKSLRMSRIYFIDHTERTNNEKRVIESEQKLSVPFILSSGSYGRGKRKIGPGTP